MMNPLKLSVIVCGAAAGLATAPYIVKQALPPEISKPELVQQNNQPEPQQQEVALSQDLPIAENSPSLQAVVPSETAISVAAVPAPTATPVPESTPLPAPAPVSEFVISTPAVEPSNNVTEIASLPSLSASAPTSDPLPKPDVVEVPTPAPTPLPYQAEVAEVQGLLKQLGYNVGRVDGKLGPKTGEMVSSYQTKAGLTASGVVDADTLSKLKAEVAAKEEEEKARKLAEAQAKAEAEKAAAAEAEQKSKELELAADSVSEDEEETTSLNSTEIAQADMPDMVMVRKTSGDSDSGEEKPVAKAEADTGPVPTLNSMEDVRRIQERLFAAKVYDGAIDGKWGKLTIDAMKAFQEKNDLEVTGKPNEKTWKKLSNITESQSKEIAKNVTPVDPGPVPTLSSVADVKKIQEKLLEARVYEGEADGKWGKLTIDAMKSFQEQNGLDITGKPNLETWKKMNEVASGESLKKSSAVVNKAKAIEVADIGPVPSLDSADDIKLLQEKLFQAGFYDGNIDGKWGNMTTEAMKKYQEDNDLKVTGKPNTETWKKLNSGIADTLSIAKSAKKSKDAVVVLNADGASKSTVKAIATPKAVSETAKSGDIKKNEINKEIEDAKARIESVNNNYDLKTYAPKSLDSLNGLVNKLSKDMASQDSNSEKTKESIKRINEELEKAKTESQKKRADRKVSGVEESYKEVKNKFTSYIKSFPAKSEAEKEKKENLESMMGKIDAGFEAMKSDFKKGNYEPIIERCDGFQMMIGIFANDLSKGYLKAELAKKSVNDKLPKNRLNEIKSLQDKNKNFEAALLLEKEINRNASTSQKKSEKKG